MSFVIEFTIYNDFGINNKQSSLHNYYFNYCVSINSSKNEIPNKYCDIKYKNTTHEIKFIFIIQRNISEIIDNYVYELIKDGLISVSYIDDDNLIDFSVYSDVICNHFNGKNDINLIFTCKNEIGGIDEHYLINKFVKIFKHDMIDNYIIIAKDKTKIQRYAASIQNYDNDIKAIINNLKDYEVLF